MLLRARRHSLIKLNSQYWVRDNLDVRSTVADCGVGDNPDFSIELIRRYGVQSHVFEPTRKHHLELERLARTLNGKLVLHKEAIADKAGPHRFFESRDNVSGSLLEDHVNVLRDSTRVYNVEAITLADVIRRVGSSHVDLLKLDIEGEEYSVIPATDDETISSIDQLIVEFHHYCVGRYLESDTQAILRRMRSLGFKDFTHDGKTYILFRDSSFGCKWGAQSLD